MPHSRKRTAHHAYHAHTSVPGRQQAKGRIIWAILFAVFGLAMAFFASGTNYVVLAAGAITGALVGYLIGKSMEKEASHK